MVGSIQRHAIATRHRPAITRVAAPAPGNRRIDPPAEPLSIDPQATQILRGLLVGLPIGLAIWMLFAFILWELV